MSAPRPSLVIAAAVAALLAPAVFPATARAQQGRFVISAGGGLAFGSLSWQRSATWPVYQEDAELDASQDAGSGGVFEGALSFRIAPRFGIRASYTQSSRDASATVDARIPHPFFFGRPRTVTGEVGGLQYKEKDAHFDVELWPVTGRFEVVVFGGVALVSVDADLVDQVEYTEAYPFDEATYRSATTSRTSSDGKVGWSAGAGVVYTLAPHWGLSAQARYTKASVELAGSDGTTTTFDAGGWRAVGLVRFGF